ncbi:MAG TPA: hypothetical protein VFZ52_10435 [Chryseolinea sp.]
MKRAIQIFAVLVLAIACDNDEQNSPIENTDVPFPTEAGIAIGAAVTMEIGPSGGTIRSDDALLDIIVPPGAVSTNTTFSVQPITNFCPGGINGYRLLPGGTNFNAPVKLVFYYKDENAGENLADLLGIAYQAPDNVWYTLPDAEVNTVNKTISVEVKHFTDWTAIEYMGIFPKIPEVPELRVNTTKELSVYGQGMGTEEDDLPPLPRNPDPNNNPSPGEDELPPLPVPRPFKTKWFVNGVENGNDRVGRISAGNAVSHSIIYKAPATVPDDGIVLVSAEITGLRKWTIEGGKPKVKKYNKVILFKRIKILPSEYDYTLRIEYKGDFACGFEGQIYNDITTLDVHVKGEDVTIKNIVNHEPTVAPPSISVSGCTMHCDPGTIGTLNVVSGSGFVIPPTHSGDQWKFSLLLNHVSLATGSSHKFECPDADPVIANGEPYEAPQSLAFILNDSIQTNNTSNGEVGTFLTLTPK